MAEDRQGQDPIEQLVDLFVYAPIGLLYEYDEIRERLVKRGKSQVQLARVIGQLAVSGRRAAGDPNDVAETASAAVTKVVTEIGTLLGLITERQDPSPHSAADPASEPVPELRDHEPPATGPSSSEPSPTDRSPAGDAPPPTMPIEGYDELTAKAIIPLLDELSAEERSVVRLHELAGRARKTVLTKLDRLDH